MNGVESLPCGLALGDKKSDIIGKKSVIIKGSGEPLVLLHGYMSSKEAFAGQIEFFSRYFTVCAPDLTGFGENAEMPYPYSLDDYVAEFLRLTESLGGRVRVIAHSFGCRIALKAAATSNVIEKAALCGVAGLKPAFSFKRFIKKRSYALLKRFIPREVAEKLFFSADYRLAKGNLKQSFKAVTSEYLDGLLPSIKCPVFCLFGEKDKDTPPALLKRLKRGVPHCDGTVMRGCGHFCFIDNPAEFNLIVREFLL